MKRKMYIGDCMETSFAYFLAALYKTSVVEIKLIGAMFVLDWVGKASCYQLGWAFLTCLLVIWFIMRGIK